MKIHSIEERAIATKKQIEKGIKPEKVDLTGDIPSELCGEYITSCPICLKLVKVYFVIGSTWIDTCSKECGEKYWELDKRRCE